MKKASRLMNTPSPLFSERLGLFIAILIPFIALGLQWVLWQYIAPFVWFLFFPAVFFSARLGRLKGGLISTILSALIVVYFFMSPQLSWEVKNPYNLFSVGMFVVMGILFSDIQERFWAANQRTKTLLNETQTANKKITELYEKTRELDELKTQFFANVSHELRTPLTLILAPVQKAIQSPKLDPELRHDLDVVQRNAHFLHKHVNDLLDVSKLDAGQMMIRYSQIDLAHLIRVLASHFNVIADERHIQYQVEVDGSVPAQVDPEKYQRILLNLLSNAFKFTPDDGTIKLALSVEEDDVVLQVCDSGPGIPSDQREVVFERFRQLEGHASRKHGGTGLGLSIVKEFVELHHGKIYAGDSPEGGAMFTVRIPLSAPADAVINPAPVEMEDTASRQLVDELFMERIQIADPVRADVPDAPLILVVEDNPDMNEFISSALAKQYRVSTARNGQAGLEKALALKPDLIVTDVMMPIMSGDQMALAIREHAELKDVPIVMLTAKADETLRVEMLQAGVQDYIHKPFIIAELSARIGNLLSARRLGADALHESDKKYRELFDNATLAIFQSTIDGKVLLVNPAFSKMFGYESPADVKTQIKNISTEIFADPQRRLEIIRLRAENPQLNTFENLYRRKDGSTFMGQLYIRNIKDSSGGVIGFEGFIEDISERKQAETRLRLFWDLPLIGMALTSPDRRFLVVNQKLANMIGYTTQELVGMTWVELTHPDDVAPNLQLLEEVIAGQREQYTLDKRFIRRDGQILYAHIAAHCVRNADGMVDYLALVIQDVTEAKLAEETLKKTKELLSSTERIGNAGGWELNIDTKLQIWTEGIYRIHEVDPSYQPTMEEGLNFYAPLSRPIIENAVQRAIESGEPFNVELEIITAKGNQRWVHAIGRADLEHRRIYGFFQDITTRKQLDEKLRLSEANFRNLAESTTDGILIGTAAGQHVYANNRAALLLGYTPDELLQTCQKDLADPSAYPQLKQRLEDRIAGRDVPSRYETIIRRKDGSSFHAEVAGTRTIWQGQACDLVFLRDITERKQAEEALQGFAYFPALNPGPALSVNADGTVKLANGAAGKIGLVSGTVLISVIQEMASFNLPDCIQNGSIHTFETRQNDRVFLLTIHGVPNLNQAYMYGSDITERKQAEVILQARMKISEFADSHTLDELLQMTLDEAEALTGSMIGFGHFIEADQKTLKLQMWSTNTLKNMCTAEGKDSHYPVEQAGVWVDAVRTRTAVIHNDYPSLAHRKGLPEGHAPVTRELVVPILRNDLIVMLMGVGNKPTDYTDQDVSTVSQLADFCWDIIQRKRVESIVRENEERYRAVVSNAPGIIFTTDDKGIFTLSEGKGLDRLGLQPGQVVGQSVLDIYKDYPDIIDTMKKALGGSHQRHESKVQGIVFDIMYSPILDQHGRVEKILGVATDITERKRAEESLRTSELFNKSILNSLTAHIAVLDENGVIIAVNEAWKKFARENGSTDPEAYLGDNYLAVCQAAIRSGDQTADQVDLGIYAVMNGVRSLFKAEYPCNAPAQQRWFTITVVPLQQPTKGVIVIHQDITESKQAQQSLEASQVLLKTALDMEKELARTDSLTGVHNRRYLYEIAEREFEISQRYQQPLAVLMFDIDHFKKFNDTYGHMLGDQILKMVTDAAVRELRSADAIGRYGGEEFIILLPMTSTEQAYSLAERIRTSVAGQNVPTEKGDAHVTLSIGIVEKQLNSRTESVEEVFQRADEAMYAAKQAGRNRTEIGQ